MCTTFALTASGFKEIIKKENKILRSDSENKECFIRITRDKQHALIVPLLYSTYWLLHVSAVACHHQGVY
jgi:hypothetical protein